MEKEPSSSSTEEPPQLLFPVFNQESTTLSDSKTPRLDDSGATPAPGPSWLCNTSFTADISVFNATISSRYDHAVLAEEEEEEEEEEGTGAKAVEEEKSRSHYELVTSSASDEDLDGSSRKKKEKRRKKNRKRDSREEAPRYGYGISSRKENVQSWADRSSNSAATKEYYFDSRGDRDNLALGCLYRMDVARYKLVQGTKSSWINYSLLARLKQRIWGFDAENDVSTLDDKLRSEGRYWSAKHASLENRKNVKRIRIVAPKESVLETAADFISLSDEKISSDGPVDSSLVEESWEDEVLRKTRDFNRMTREQPYNEKIWLDFAEFQDKVASMQPQRGARLQILEKKISILEKAAELNPDNEELLISLMNAYERKDNSDVLIGRWEKLLMHHSGSYKLWREFLRLLQGDFSRFKVSEIRKMFANAIHALSASCSKQHRQVHQNATAPSGDPLLVEQEHGLVNIFVGYCRFEWQSGYQELATALFQAEIEYSLFCPSLLLSEQGKRRLFEHFWNSTGARIGEDGALGWSTWLEKEEEQRQKVMINESSSTVDEGGWTGWYEPKSKDAAENQENTAVDDVGIEGADDESKTDDMGDDTEALMKMLGISAETEANGEVQDVATWNRWLVEELSRDSDQWMPVRPESGNTLTDEITDKEGDEQLLRAVLFEDISEYLFSVTTEEVRLFLVYHLIDFYGGRIPQWLSTNSSSWAEKTLMTDSLPDSVLDDLRKVHDMIKKIDGCQSNESLEYVIGSSDNISMRSEMMKFLRNATLCCLNLFPNDHILKEAVLVAEELSNTRMNSCSYAVTPCRALAKNLLKSNRQDAHLCGVYARREAAFGNIDHARKVFDMALSSIEVVSIDSQSNVLLLFLWYAEVELANSSSGSSESISRALHILSCLGCEKKYSSFKSQPSSLQLLRARQGFKERLRIIQSTWIHGVINDNSIALVCSAALFEVLTTGMDAAIEVLNQAFSTVLPERRSQNYQLEFLFNFYVGLLSKHHSQSDLAKVWVTVMEGLQIYPFSPHLYSALVQIGHLHTSPTKLRWIIDDYLHKKPSVTLCLFALAYEISRGGSRHRLHGIFERALASNVLRNSVLLWRLYMSYEIHVTCDASAARRIYFRAIHTCPWSKRLWLDGFQKLSSVLTAKELSDLLEVMRDKELNVRTDVYEILLQDDMDS